MLRKIIRGIILLGISGISYAQYANVDQLNNSASCDSTCSIDPNKVQTLSGQNQKLGNCGYGYIGSNLEERVINQDGSWGDWRVVNRDNCACSPLTENQEVACPTNQRGQHIQTRDWTCPSVAQGEYTSWVTKSNTCDYYYLSTSAEEQTIACPLNQRGTHIQTRNYENWSDSSKRNQTAWTTKSNTCDYYLTAASQIETGSIACPSGYTGTITQQRTYDRWSDGNARNHSAWTEVSRNCVISGIAYNAKLEYWINTSAKQEGFKQGVLFQMPTFQIRVVAVEAMRKKVDKFMYQRTGQYRWKMDVYEFGGKKANLPQNIYITVNNSRRYTLSLLSDSLCNNNCTYYDVNPSSFELINFIYNNYSLADNGGYLNLPTYSYPHISISLN